MGSVMSLHQTERSHSITGVVIDGLGMGFLGRNLYPYLLMAKLSFIIMQRHQTLMLFHNGSSDMTWTIFREYIQCPPKVLEQ